MVGISRDLSPSQAKFKETVNGKNVFLSDVDGEVIKRYGAFNADAKIARRYYFLVDEKGKLIWKNVTGQLIPTEKLVEDLTVVTKSN